MKMTMSKTMKMLFSPAERLYFFKPTMLDHEYAAVSSLNKGL